MILDFDIDLAKDAVELGTGKVITRDGKSVSIIDWDSDSSSFYPIVGKLCVPSSQNSPCIYWSSQGHYITGCTTKLDLFLEIFDD